MGARIGLVNRRVTAAGEPVADLEVRPRELVATEIEPEIVPSLVDELPLVALAASCARGRTTVRGAEELRVKESDRIETTARGALQLRRARRGHQGRLARSAASRRASAAAPSTRTATTASRCWAPSRASTRESGVRVVDAGAIDVSFPEFRGLLDALREAPE